MIEENHAIKILYNSSIDPISKRVGESKGLRGREREKARFYARREAPDSIQVWSFSLPSVGLSLGHGIWKPFPVRSTTIATDFVKRNTQCTPCPSSFGNECPTIGRSGNYKNFQCQPGHYNDLASLFFNTNDDAIRNLFSPRHRKQFQISTILIFFVGTYFLGIITYGIVVSSGLFIPVILAGSSYGRLVGPISNLDVGLFSLLGAASFLGGTMRMRVSLCVILLELTNDLLMLPLVMLVLLISKTVADSFNKGKGLKVEDLDLSVEEMEMYVDLYPITNTSPYMVVETMFLAKAAAFFENLP
ncbi:Chloride channel protein CLC-c [Sesamum angolense]|uniref:Chloride channel protein CLC-c n=1 Tax=Sesamum angolense TaxID=2727404 RepID=A0AAE1WAK4_9LAMI|nr:Chloride channel protein CLC-c [Sesamum angolense]